MAVTATLVTIEGVPFPFIGTGVPAAQLITPIPSAEFTFNVINTEITVAAGGQTQSLLINCPLPRSFCYVLVECVMQIIGNDAGDWDARGVGSVLDSASSPTTLIPFELASSGAGFSPVLGRARTYLLSVPITKVLVPTAVDNGLLTVFAVNNNIDGAVGKVTFYARFLRYDRIQAQYWQVNTPVLVR